MNFCRPLRQSWCRVKSRFDAGVPLLVTGRRARYDRFSTSAEVPHAHDPRRHRRPRRHRARARPQACRRHAGPRRSPARPRAIAPRRRPGSTPSGSPVRWSSSRRFRRMPIWRSNARRPSVLERICRPMLEAGKTVMVLSAGALLPRPELIELAKAHGGQIIVPTGALLGLDAVTAAAEGQIHSVRMDHPQAAQRPRRRALSGGEPHLGRGAQRAQTGVRRHRPRGGGRVSGQRQRGGGAVARRDRAGPHHDGDLGRPHRRAELPHHRGRQRFRPADP